MELKASPLGELRKRERKVDASQSKEEEDTEGVEGGKRRSVSSSLLLSDG